jgi:hypothetical protein
MTTYAYLYQAIYLNDPGSAKLYLPEAGTRIEKISLNVTIFQLVPGLRGKKVPLYGYR